MRSWGIPRFTPALVLLAALATATFVFLHAPGVRADCNPASSACPTPSPSPIPVNAFLSLDVTAGDPNTVITVTGGQFLANEQMNLFWDIPNHIAGTAMADSNGSFSNVKVKTYPGDAPGGHKLCASVEPNPCARFTINGPPSPTPSPSPSPSPSESPSPSGSPGPVTSAGPTPSPAGTSLSGFDVISRPPFVFLPLAGVLGVVLSLGYWAVSVMRRPRQRPLRTAAVMHRAMRPDYSAGFGTPPPAPNLEAEPSAWNEPVHELPPPEPPATEATAPPQPPTPAAPAEPTLTEADWGQPVEWGTGSADWGFPEPPPDDNPEAPPPTD